MKIGWRLAALGLTFLGLLAILLTRLWFVQVAAGEEYARDVENQQIKLFPTLGARGDILDREGTVLATSKLALAVVVDRAQISVEEEEQLIQRLSSLLGVAAVEIKSQVEAAGSGNRFVLREIGKEEAHHIWQNATDFPGVTIEDVPVRVYPEEDLAAHVIGHIGLPDPADLEEDPDLNPNLTVGRLGIERYYDDVLQGEEGFVAYNVNARNEVLREAGERPSSQGSTVVLTIDGDTQLILEEALERGVQLANRVKGATGDYNNLAKHAAGVVLDIQSGQVVAMASYPDFRPGDFVGGIRNETYQVLLEQKAFSNLVIQGLYPPASTFKAITYATAIQERIYPRGVADPEGRIECSASLNASFNDGSANRWRNWTFPEDDGYQNIHEAFERSCNIYFYEVALSIWRRFKDTDRESVLQEWAKGLGFGSATGIDLPFEHKGTVPDRALFEEWARTSPGRVRPEGWQGGDLMNLAIGQGELLTTPLQMAIGFGALINGGRVWEPRVVDMILDRNGEIIEDIEPRIAATVDIEPRVAEMLRQDMVRVTTTGTARVAFEPMGGAAYEVGGKTGTAQMGGQDRDNTAWFIGATPMSNPRYVVAVMIEEGGSGGRIAAPTARYVFEYLAGREPSEIRAGEKAD